MLECRSVLNCGNNGRICEGPQHRLQVLMPYHPQALLRPLILHPLARTHAEGLRNGQALEQGQEPEALRSAGEGFQHDRKIQEREGWQGWNQQGEWVWESKGEGCQAGEGY